MTKGYLTVNGTGSKDIYGGKRKGLGPKKDTYSTSGNRKYSSHSILEN